jgi:Methyltransferase domain
MTKFTNHIRQTNNYIQKRLYVYNISNNFLNKKNILDIASHSGAIGKNLLENKTIGTYTAVEPDPNFINNYQDLINQYPNQVIYHNCDFEQFTQKTTTKYDTIFFLACVAFINLSMDEIFNQLDQILENNGIIIIESTKDFSNFYELINVFKNNKHYNIINQGEYDEMEWKRGFYVIQKKK